MKEIQSINNYPICDAEARAELENKANKYHEHEEYATKTYVNTLINNFDINDFDMSDFATKEDVEDAVANIEIPDVDLSNYATKDYVAEQIANADPDVDLSNYALKADIPTKVSQLENDAEFISYYDLCLKDENGDFVVDENGDHILKNFITKTEVQEMIDEAVLGLEEDGTPVDLSAYQTKTDNTLSTNNKTIVGAINELFQNANNGKEIIADAIGGELQSSDTFSAMGTKIDNMGDILGSFIVDNGGSIVGNENLSQLLDILYTAIQITFPGEDEEIDPNPTLKEDILYSPHVVRTKDYTYILKEDNTLWESDHTNAYFGSYNFKQRMTDVKKVAGNAEGEFCMVLKNDGTLWAKGKNEYGQLGLGNTTTASGFTKVTTNTDGGVIDVACGDRETMIIKTDYSVWVCGKTCFGLKNESNLASFTRVTDENIIDGSQIKKIVMSGEYESCFVLKTDGVLWGCGNDGNGQLGSNSNYGDSTKDFIQIPNMTNVKDIVTSRNHSVLLKNDGTVWGTGMNTYGALGRNPDNYPSFRVFTQIPNIDNVVQIATGESHTVALKSDGSLMGTGYYDALGMPMPSSTSWYNNFKNITYGVVDPCEIYGFYDGYFYVKEDGRVFKNNSHAESNGPNDYEAGTIDLKIAIK